MVPSREGLKKITFDPRGRVGGYSENATLGYLKSERGSKKAKMKSRSLCTLPYRYSQLL